jgi:hypothetical protein
MLKLTVEFEAGEIDKVKSIVERKLKVGRRFVLNRHIKNVDGPPPAVTDDDIWTTHMMCLLTTQQRSGPGSPINKLLDMNPSPLSLAACRQMNHVSHSVLQILNHVGGIRRTNKIATAMQSNLALLDNGEWAQLRHWRDVLLQQRTASPQQEHRAAEEQAARYMNQFREFGPKQARNFWQSLGLTRYVFVLDSRIIRWLQRELAFETGLLTPDGLGDEKYYEFVSNLLFELCSRAAVLPCLFDAAIFDSFDEATEWSAAAIW